MTSKILVTYHNPAHPHIKTGHSDYISEDTCCFLYPTSVNLEKYNPNFDKIQADDYTYPIKMYRGKLAWVVINFEWKLVRVESFEEEVIRLRNEVNDLHFQLTQWKLI